MKKIFLTSFIFCLAIMLCGAGINDAFVQQQTEKGWLFHIFSQKMPSLDNKSKELKYDFTYLQQTDSVTLLATIVTGASCTPDSLKISYCGNTYTAPARLVYFTPGKKKSDIRIKAAIPFPVWNDMYSCSTPFVLQFSMQDGATPETYIFGYDNKKWKSNRDKINVIINSIRINTGKR